MMRTITLLRSRFLLVLMLMSAVCFAQGWKQKANFSGGQRAYAFSFVVGNRAFMGTGLNPAQVNNDFWEYDAANDTWMQRAAFIGQARYSAVAFTIGAKGYVGTGASVHLIGSANFYEYDPATNTWRIRTSLINGFQRLGGVGFAIGAKGYIGLGRNNTSFKNDLWEYDPATNKWVQRANYPGLACADATAFTIGTKAYVGLGYNATTAFRNFYEFDPSPTIYPLPFTAKDIADFRIGPVKFIFLFH